MLCQRLRRWYNINPALGQSPVILYEASAVYVHVLYNQV